LAEWSSGPTLEKLTDVLLSHSDAASSSSSKRESATRLEAAGRLLRVPFVTVFEYLRVGLCCGHPICCLQQARLTWNSGCSCLLHVASKLHACAAQFLQLVAEALRPLGRGAAFYLAAAVSDFFVPWSEMVQALDVSQDALHASKSGADVQMQQPDRLPDPAVAISQRLQTSAHLRRQSTRCSRRPGPTP
jgi:hypothetical protein